MRIFVFLLVVTSVSAFAQSKPLFKIISCSEEVTIDGVRAEPGEIVHSNSIQLNIPKDNYLGIITIEGYAYLLTKNIKVKAVNKMVKSSGEEASRMFMGAVNRYMPEPFKVAGVKTNETSEIYGDSILVAFKCYYKDKPPFKITFISMYEKIIAEYQINRTWEVFSTDSLFKNETAFIFGISSQDRKQSSFPFVKKIRPKLKGRLDFDFRRLNKDTVMQLAFYEINKLYYDHIFQLYKIETSKIELDLDEFLSAYLARTKDKVHLEEYITK